MTHLNDKNNVIIWHLLSIWHFFRGSQESELDSLESDSANPIAGYKILFCFRISPNTH